jgi:hypothetical protein
MVAFVAIKDRLRNLHDNRGAAKGENMNSKRISFLFALFSFLLLSIACGLFAPATNETSKPANAEQTSVWPDVPLYPNATPDPANAYLSIFNQSTQGMMTMIFYTDQNPADVVTYYTDDMMKQQGWTPQPYAVVKWFSVGDGMGPATPERYTSGGCETATRSNGEKIAYCTFSKTDDKGQDVELTIAITPDDKSDQYQIVYVRMTDVSATAPAP